MTFAIILLVVVVLVVLWGIATYNRFVQQHEMVPNAMAQIAAQVESRWDALTNLIQATKSYQSHEADTLAQVVGERSGLTRDSSVQDVERDDNAFREALRSVNALAEQYPDLKASSVYQTTMNSVNQYENNVRQARMVYNDTVTRYNRLIKTFPNSLVASMTGFQPEDYFKGSPEKAEMPQW